MTGFVGTSLKGFGSVNYLSWVIEVASSVGISISAHTVIAWDSWWLLFIWIGISSSAHVLLACISWSSSKRLIDSLLWHRIWTRLVNILSGVKLIESLCFYVIKLIIKSNYSWLLWWVVMTEFSIGWLLTFTYLLFHEVIVLILVSLIGEFILIVLNWRLIVSSCRFGVDFSCIRLVFFDVLRSWSQMGVLSLISIQRSFSWISFIWNISERLSYNFRFLSRDMAAPVNWIQLKRDWRSWPLSIGCIVDSLRLHLSLVFY